MELAEQTTGAPQQKPAALGYRLPAEWETHDATWIVWPHHAGDWPGKFAAIPLVYAEISRRLLTSERLCIVVNAKSRSRAQEVLFRVGVDPAEVEFFDAETNRSWIRDTGPIFLKHQDSGSLAVARFQFNGWARYRNWQLDNELSPLITAQLGLAGFNATVCEQPIVLEGGAIDVNGTGTLMTTEECLLDQHVQVRNPGLAKADLEQLLKDYLGISHLVWLKNGLAGDDTHGHIDDICRFVARDTVVLCRSTNPKDENYRICEENAERLSSARLETGERINMVSLPLPSPLYFEGVRLPASYANFYIGNKVVLVPTFNDPNDRIALGTLSELFLNRQVIGIHAVDLVWGLGTLHCLTQQQPVNETPAIAL